MKKMILVAVMVLASTCFGDMAVTINTVSDACEAIWNAKMDATSAAIAAAGGALDSEVDGNFIPYTGATKDVNLGTRNLKVVSVTGDGNNAITLTPNVLTGNDGNAIVAPYDTILTTAANWGGGATSMECVFRQHQYRIRQTGTIKAVRFYVPTDVKWSNCTSMVIKIWRSSGTYTLNLIGTSENILSQLTQGQTCTVTFATPLTGVQEGDYYGYRIEGETSLPSLTANTSLTTALETAYKVNVAAWVSGHTTQDGVSDSFYNYVVPMYLYMSPPQVVFVGDSIAQGIANNSAFTQMDVCDFDPTTYWGHQVAADMGWTYQNMGHGSDTTAQILARWTADVNALNPRYVIIEGGINDILASTSNATIIANWTSMLANSRAAGITPIIVPILPCNAMTTTMARNRDTVNAAIIALAPTYGAIVVENTNQALGQFKAGGDANNLWNFKTGINDSGAYHLSATGSTAFSRAILASMCRYYTTGTSKAALGDFNNVQVSNNADITGTTRTGDLIVERDVNVGGAFISSDPNTDHATTLYLDVNDGNNVRRLQVVIGDANSAGEGYRTLRIPN
jgi:lysophospholipase L1-like esterase